MKRNGASDYSVRKAVKEFTEQEPLFKETYDAMNAYRKDSVETQGRLAGGGVWTSGKVKTNELIEFESIKTNKPIVDSARAYLEEAQKRTDRTGYKYDSPTKRENWVNSYCKNSPKGNDPEYRKRVLDRFNKSIKLLRQEKNGTLKNSYKYKGFGEYGRERRGIHRLDKNSGRAKGLGYKRNDTIDKRGGNRAVLRNSESMGKGSSRQLATLGEHLSGNFGESGSKTSQAEVKKNPYPLNGFKRFDEFTPEQKKRLKDFANEVAAGIPEERIRELGSLAYSVRKTSQLTEKDRLEYGLLTKEEKRARKELVGKKSVYVKYHNSNKVPQGEEKIRLGIDYHSNSYGIFGGTASLATPGRLAKMSSADTIKSVYLDSAKTQALKKIMNYVYDNFSEPVINNKIKAGYVGVNKHLLNICKALDASPDFYRLLDSNPEEIKKQFKHLDERKYYTGIHNRTRNVDCQIPEEVFKTLLTGSGESAEAYWQRYLRGGNYGNIGMAGAKWAAAVSDAFLDAFKKNVLTSGSFFANNRGGNFNLIASFAKNPVELAKAYYDGVFNVKNKDIPQELLSHSILEAVENSTKLKHYSNNAVFDNFANLFNGHLIDTKDLERRIAKKKSVITKHGLTTKREKELLDLQNGLKFAKKANVLATPMHLFNKLVPVIQKFNEKFENYERRVAYSLRVNQARKDIIKKTGQQILTTKEGIKAVNSNPELKDLMVKRVEDILGNYSNFTPVERRLLKRLVPFYSWYRTVYRNIKTLAKENPVVPISLIQCFCVFRGTLLCCFSWLYLFCFLFAHI